MDNLEWSAALRNSFAEISRWVAEYQPRLLGAFTLLVIGLGLAMVLRALSVRLVRALDRLTPGRALRGSLHRLGIERQVSEVVGTIIFWVVLLFFVAAATDALGLPILSTWLSGMAFYLPRLLAAGLVVLIGLIVANLARDAMSAAGTAAGIAYGSMLGQIARVSILVAATLIAVAELGIDITLLTAVLSVALAATLGGLALAFGLGARTAVSNIIGSHYARQTFQVGQTVQLDGIEGEIALITATAVIIRAADGRVVVPAKRFSESAAKLVTAGA